MSKVPGYVMSTSGSVLFDSRKGKTLLRDVVVEAHERGWRLDGADLADTDLTGVALFGSHMEGASFARSNLTGVDFNYTNLRRADFTDAVLDGARCLETDFRDTKLVRTSAKGVRFNRCKVASRVDCWVADAATAEEVVQRLMAYPQAYVKLLLKAAHPPALTRPVQRALWTAALPLIEAQLKAAARRARTPRAPAFPAGTVQTSELLCAPPTRATLAEACAAYVTITGRSASILWEARNGTDAEREEAQRVVADLEARGDAAIARLGWTRAEMDRDAYEHAVEEVARDKREREEAAGRGADEVRNAGGEVLA